MHLNRARRRIALSVVSLAAIPGLAAVAAPPASAADPAGTLGKVVINEVSSNGYNHGATTNRDFVELFNMGPTNVDLSGYRLADSAGGTGVVLDGVLPAGGYVVIWNNESSAGATTFGLGSSDRIDFLAPDGTTIDSYGTWASHLAPSHARVPDGTGALAVSTTATPGGSNALSTEDALVTINEYASDPADFVELHNAGPTAVSLEGWSLADGATEVQGDEILFGAGVQIPAGGYLSLPTEGTQAAGITYANGASPGYGVSMTDHLWLRNDANALVSTTWVGTAADGTTTRHAQPSWARTSQGVGLWKMSTSATPGAVNSFGALPPAPPLDPNWSDVEVNEISSLNVGDDGNPGFGDAVELHNKGASAVSVDGWWQSDGSAGGAAKLALADLKVWDGDSFEPAAAMSIPPGGYVAFSSKEGLSGEGDGVQVFGPGNDAASRQLVDSATYGDGDGGVSDNYESDSLAFAACPNGSDDFWRVTASSFGRDNTASCATKTRRLATPVVLNEVANLAGKVELLNTGAAAVDISGWQLLDSTGTVVHTVPASTSLAAGAFYVAEGVTGLDGADSLTIRRASDQATVVAHTWYEDGVASYSRCELFGSVSYVETPAATFGSANACPSLDTEPWPGASTVTTVDEVNGFGDGDGNGEGDVSGAAFDPSDPSILWVVQNKNTLHKLHEVGGTYVAVAGWDGGKKLHFASGTGAVDSEGVAVGPDGSIYVTSERDNDNSGVSSNKIERYDVSAVTAATTDLTAVDEWDVNDFVVTGTNLGLEGLTYVPDDYLVESGWEVDGTRYAAATYPTPGLYAVAVEGTGALHFFSLADGAAPVEAKVESSGFPFSMDVAYDADRKALWTLCDDSCGGIYNLLDVVDGDFAVLHSYARPAGMPNLNNEGMAIAPAATCADGAQEVVWADDGDTDGFSLRAGTLPCPVLAMVVAPTIAGTPVVGETLTASPGTYEPAASSVAYQWYADGAPIAGATAATYTLTDAEVGKVVRVEVVATVEHRVPFAAMSAVVGPVEPAEVEPSEFLMTAPPSITGAAVVGNQLTASTGSWTPAPESVAYQWYADDVLIPGATAATYTPVAGDVGSVLTVRVTVSSDGYTDGVGIAETAEVAPAEEEPDELDNTAAPEILGKAQVGKTLTGDPGSWTPEPDETTHRWLADGVAIPGATGTTLELTPDLVGSEITFEVTVSAVGFLDSTATSEPTPPVRKGNARVKVTVTPKRPTVREDRVRVVVRVTNADGVAVDGTLTVTAGKLGGVDAVLVDGRATVRIPVFRRVGERVVRVRYSGSEVLHGAGAAVDVTVVR